MSNKPNLIKGGVHIDTRGILRYVNEAKPGIYKRFYLITHPDVKIVRAWQGHKKEEKAFYAINGGFTIAVVNPNSMELPAEDERPDFFRLTEENKNFLRVPGGNYTGIKAISPNATLLVLSSMDIEDSKADDYRQASDKWVDWNTVK